MDLSALFEFNEVTSAIHDTYSEGRVEKIMPDHCSVDKDLEGNWRVLMVRAVTERQRVWAGASLWRHKAISWPVERLSACQEGLCCDTQAV